MVISDVRADQRGTSVGRSCFLVSVQVKGPKATCGASILARGPGPVVIVTGRGESAVEAKSSVRVLFTLGTRRSNRVVVVGVQAADRSVWCMVAEAKPYASTDAEEIMAEACVVAVIVVDFLLVCAARLV